MPAGSKEQHSSDRLVPDLAKKKAAVLLVKSLFSVCRILHVLDKIPLLLKTAEKWDSGLADIEEQLPGYGFAAGFSSSVLTGFGACFFQNSGSAFTHSSRG